jgi:hypothetical protein
MSPRRLHLRTRVLPTGDTVYPQAKSQVQAPNPSFRFKASKTFVNPRRQHLPSTYSRTIHPLAFIGLREHGMGLVMTRSVSEATSLRETKSRRNAKSHEGYNHKRVCITGSNRNHRAFVCAGPYWQPPSDGRGGTRILAVGTDSLWRRSEWDQWLWPPHGQRPVSSAPEPQRATV